MTPLGLQSMTQISAFAQIANGKKTAALGSETVAPQSQQSSTEAILQQQLIRISPHLAQSQPQHNS
eukprot:11696-Heterococcus_DN1.PRE.2